MDYRLARMMVTIRRNKFGGFRLLASIIQNDRIENRPPVLNRGKLTFNLQGQKGATGPERCRARKVPGVIVLENFMSVFHRKK